MQRASTIDVLNRLLATLYRSLPMYLADAWPWHDSRDRQALTVLENVIHDQRAMCERIATAIQDRRGAVDTGDFPMAYTDTQFLSLDFLLNELIEYQRQDIAAIEACAADLRNDPAARSLAEEALGQERAHLDSLEVQLRQPVGRAFQPDGPRDTHAAH